MGGEESRRSPARDLGILFHLVAALLLVGNFAGPTETRSHLSRRRWRHILRKAVRSSAGLARRCRPEGPVLSAGVTGTSQCPCTRLWGLRTPGHMQVTGGRERLCYGALTPQVRHFLFSASVSLSLKRALARVRLGLGNPRKKTGDGQASWAKEDAPRKEGVQPGP